MAKDGWLQIRVGEELLVRIAENACRESRSISEWCRLALIRAVLPVTVLQATAATVPLRPNRTATCDPEGKITVERESTSEFSPKNPPRAPKSPKEAHSEAGGDEKTQEKPRFSPVEPVEVVLSAVEQAAEAQKASRSLKTPEMPTNLKPSEMQAWKRAHRL